MNDTFDDDKSTIPSLLDRERLAAMPVDGRVEAENRMWVVCRYPARKNDRNWREYVIMVNHPQLPRHTRPHEVSELATVIKYLENLDGERVKGREG